MVTSVFITNTQVADGNAQLSVQSASLVKSTDGNVAFAITIENIGAKPITTLTFQLINQQPTTVSVPPNGLEPGASASAFSSPTGNYISGQTYAVNVAATFSGGSSVAQSMSVTCQGNGPTSPTPTRKQTPPPSHTPTTTPSPPPNPTAIPTPIPTPSPAVPQNQTVFFGSSQTAVNAVTAKALCTSLPGQQGSVVYDHAGGWVYHWGIRVFKLSADGQEVEVTSGSPVAVVTVGTDAQGRFISGGCVKTATWTPPQTTLASSDAIVIKVYYECSGTPWTQAGQWATPQLGAVCLNNQTWTINYYLSQSWYYNNNDDQYHYRGSFNWGTPTYDSCIKNFTWTPL